MHRYLYIHFIYNWFHNGLLSALCYVHLIETLLYLIEKYRLMSHSHSFILSFVAKWKQNVYGNDIDPHSKQTIKGNSKSQNTEKKEQIEDTTTGLECMVCSEGVKDEDGELELTVKNSVGMENNNKGTTKETDTISKSTIEVLVNGQSDDILSSHASNDNDYKLKPRKLNSNSFARTEITTNADGLDAVVVESEDALETGEGLYLGENRSKSFSENITVKDILHSRCKERLEAREKKRAEEKLRMKQSQQLPQYKEVDVGLLKTMKRSSVTPVLVPTFEELIDVLERENYTGKYRRPVKMSKRITKHNNKKHEAPTSGISPNGRKIQGGRIRLPPINLQKSGRQGYTIKCKQERGGVTKSKACENWVKSQEVTKRSPRTEPTTFTDEEEGDRSVSVDYETELSDFDFFRHDSPSLGLEIPVLFLTTPSGTTLELALYQSDDESEIPVVDNITPRITETRSSTTSSSSLNEEERQMATTAVSKGREWLKRKILQIGKTSRQNTGMFDTKKLNLKYSFERLVKEKTKRKPSFYDALKKYYKIHKVVNKCQETPVNKDGRNPLNLETEEGEEEEERDEKGDTIPFGKLKKFAFLDHNPQKGYEEENISFATNSMDGFTTKVLKSLDDFVVRKEQVVSDFYSKISISITFTRKSAFKI